MQATVERIKYEEDKKNGLIIIQALYGKFPEDRNLDDNDDDLNGGSNSSRSNDSNSDDMVIDVTIPLQCLVRDSKLVLYNSSKSELPGFYDPCVGETKKLKIEYKYRNVISKITINDTEAIKLPSLSLNNSNTTNIASTSNNNSFSNSNNDDENSKNNSSNSNS